MEEKKARRSSTQTRSRFGAINCRVPEDTDIARLCTARYNGLVLRNVHDLQTYWSRSETNRIATVPTYAARLPMLCRAFGVLHM